MLSDVTETWIECCEKHESRVHSLGQLEKICEKDDVRVDLKRIMYFWELLFGGLIGDFRVGKRWYVGAVYADTDYESVVFREW